MILSNIEIQRAIDEGRLAIDPDPRPRRPDVDGGQSCPYNTHSVDLRLHSEVSVPKSGTFTYDLSQTGSIAEFISRHSEKCTITSGQPYAFKPGQFLLARTVERVHLPLQKSGVSLAARIEGKSSRARCGILVHFTAPTVHPGFEGSLTLEMANLGPSTFLLYPGMYIAQLIVEEVTGKFFENESQFQGQSTPEGQ